MSAWHQKMKAAGFKEHRIWVHPDDWPAVRERMRSRQEERLGDSEDIVAIGPVQRVERARKELRAAEDALFEYRVAKDFEAAVEKLKRLYQAEAAEVVQNIVESVPDEPPQADEAAELLRGVESYG